MKQSAEEQNPLYDNHSANAQNAHVGRERDMSVYDFVTAAAQLTSFSSEFTILRVSQSTAAVMFVCSALHLFLCILYVCVQKKTTITNTERTLKHKIGTIDPQYIHII